MELKLKAHLNFKNKSKRAFGLGGEINFNPSADPAGELPDRLDRNNLNVYKDPAELRQLTMVWEYKTLNREELTGRRFVEEKGLE